MQLICNELSFYPLAENGHIAEARFRQLLKTFKQARTKYGFNHIRFPINYHSQQVTTTETFFAWVSTLDNGTIKNLIVDLCKQPYTDELETSELNTFFESDYTIEGENVPVAIQPVGLPVSYIKALPTISLDAHPFWRNRNIFIRKTNVNKEEDVSFKTYNICFEADIDTKEFSEWVDESMGSLVTTVDILRKYLSYAKYQTVFTGDFVEQFFEWKDNDFETFKYLLLLMKDVQIHPFTGGMGQTENLKGRGKEASKRVTQPDRLSYTLENDIVTYLACKGHYDFH